MKKQEKIRGIFRDGLITWYSQTPEGIWKVDNTFVSMHLENQIRQLRGSIEFTCSFDRSMPTSFLFDGDVISMSALTATEELKTIMEYDMVVSEKMRKQEIEEQPNKTEYDDGRTLAQICKERVRKTKIQSFLEENTPAKISERLNEYVLGQETLTKCTADFLYYHAMRLENPHLPPRPILISGPSGSGKTEVWRVIRDLYGNIFKIKIVNGARITQEGWKGNTKTLSFIDEPLSDGGILVVDEFDKLATPQYSSGGDNVAERIQSEFLKLLEGEEVFFAADKRGRVSSTEVTSKNMGFVLVGAFDQLLQSQESTKQ